MPRTMPLASPPRRKRGPRARLTRHSSSRVGVVNLEINRLSRRPRRWPDRREPLANSTALGVFSLTRAEDDEHFTQLSTWSGAIGYDRPIVLGFVLTAALVVLAVGSGAR